MGRGALDPMTGSGNDRKRPGDGSAHETDPPGGPVGLGPVFALVKKWAAVLSGALTLLAAIAFFLQPHTRSTGALVAASGAALAAAALILFGAAWAYQHRAAHLKMPLWMVIGAVVLFLGAGASLGAAFGARSTSGAGNVVGQSKATAVAGSASSTGAGAGAGASTSCPTGSAIVSAQAGLDSAQPAAELASISVLRQTMTASPDEQCAAVDALAAFIRKASPVSNDYSPVTEVVQSALTALADRNPARDGGATVDLENTDLTGANLVGAHLAGADLSGSNGADLTNANLSGANLSGANLANAYLGDANISNTDLSDADLTDASLYGTPLCSGSDVPVHPSGGYNCTQ